MATFTFILYIPPPSAIPAPQGESLHPPAPHQLPPIPHGLPVPLSLPTGMPGRQSGQPAGSHTSENRDGVEVVDLMDSDQEDTPSERQAAENGQPGIKGKRTHAMTLRL